jgi:hypothetical protein
MVFFRIPYGPVFLALSAILFSVESMASIPVRNSRVYKFHWSTEYFDSKENYFNDKTEFETNNAKGQLTTINSRTFLQQAMSRKPIYLYGGAHINYAKSTLGIVDRENSAVSEVFFGTHYWIDKKKFSVVPQVEIIASLFSVDATTDEVLTSEGAHRFKLGTWLIREFKYFRPFAYFGIEALSEGRASVSDVKIGTEILFDNMYLALSGKVIQTFKDDEDINNTGPRVDVVNRVNGGSYRYYVPNPMEMTATAQLGYRVDERMDLALNYTTQLQGLRIAKGDTITVSLSLDIGDDIESHEYLSDRKKHRKKRKKKIKKFRPGLDEEEKQLLDDDDGD